MTQCKNSIFLNLIIKWITTAQQKTHKYNYTAFGFSVRAIKLLDHVALLKVRPIKAIHPNKLKHLTDTCPETFQPFFIAIATNEKCFQFKLNFNLPTTRHNRLV